MKRFRKSLRLTFAKSLSYRPGHGAQVSVFDEEGRPGSVLLDPSDMSWVAWAMLGYLRRHAPELASCPHTRMPTGGYADWVTGICHHCGERVQGERGAPLPQAETPQQGAETCANCNRPNSYVVGKGCPGCHWRDDEAQAERSRGVQMPHRG